MSLNIVFATVFTQLKGGSRERERERVKEKEVLKRGAEHEGASSIVVPRNKVLFNLTQEMNAALYQLSVPSLHHCSPPDCM